MEDYQHKYETMASRAHGVSKDSLKEMYISGLRPEILEKLILARPETITEAFAIANIYEDLEKKKIFHL